MSRCPHLRLPIPDLSPSLAGASRCRAPGCKAQLESCWLCLQCAAVSCGQRDSAHSLLHFKESQHAVCISIASAEIWCYLCDAEVLGDDDEADGASPASVARAAVIRQRTARQRLQTQQARDADTGSLALPSRVSPAYSTALNAYAPTAGLTGLQNLGNTCFMAASLQALSHVPPLALYFTECALAARQATEGTMPVALQALLRASWLTLHSADAAAGERFPAVVPSAVLRALRRANPIFDGFAQQDSHEALRTILNELHDRSMLEIPLGLSSGSGAGAGGWRKHRPLATGSAATRPASQSASNPLYVRGRGADGGGKDADDPAVPGASAPNPLRAVSASAASVEDAPVAGSSKRRRDAHAQASSKSSSARRVGVGPDAAQDVDSDADTEPGGGSAPLDLEAFTASLPADRKWLHHGPYTGAETVQRSVVSDLFQGLLSSRVRCRTCGLDSVSYDTFTDLSLGIPRRVHPVARGGDGSGAAPRGAEAWAAKNSDKASEAGAGAAGVPPGATAITMNVLHEGGMGAEAQPAGSSGTGMDKGAGTSAPAPAPPPAKPRRSPSWCEAMAAFFKGDGSGGGGDLLRGLGPVGLGDCLYSFFDWEALTGPDQYFCERCACKRDADKRIGLACLPEVLCVHLKRFSYSSAWGGAKNDAAVRFPLEGLDLAPFLQVGAQAPNPHAAACRLYVRSKEMQAGRRLGGGGGGDGGGRPSVIEPLAAVGAMALSPEGSLSPYLPTGADGKPTVASTGGFPPTSSGPVSPSDVGTAHRRGASGRTASGASVRQLSGGAAGDGARRSQSEGAGAPPSQAYFMTPDTRSWILHRHALASGLTGVEDVTAAAALAAQDTPEAHRAATAEGAGVLPGAVAAAAAAASSGGGGGGPYVPVSPARVVDVRTMGDTRYDLVSVVQHLGSLGGGHYITHARHRDLGSWFTFDDSSVRPLDAGAVAGKEAYILFYVRRRTPRSAPVPLPPVADPSSAEPLVFVSRGWWLRYTAFATPGPVTAADVLCDHGCVKRQLAEAIRALTVPVPLSQYNVLAATYGAAEPPLRDTRPCHACRAEAAALEERRKRENAAITAVDSTSLRGDEQVWYLMSEAWLLQWRRFINNEGASDGTGRGTLPPGPIDNARLLGRGGKPLPNQRSIIHYRGVNVNVWNFLHDIYGGGPPLRRRTINLYEEEA